MKKLIVLMVVAFVLTVFSAFQVFEMTSSIDQPESALIAQGDIIPPMYEVSDDLVASAQGDVRPPPWWTTTSSNLRPIPR